MYQLRVAAPQMIGELYELDVEAWGEDGAASTDMLAARIALYPSGNYVAIDQETGRIAGSVWTVATDEQEVHTWEQATGDGRYTGVCNPFGTCVYGVNLAVRNDHLKRGVGTKLVQRVIEVAWMAGRERFQLGARMPYYHQWQEVFAAEDYIRLMRDEMQDLYFQDPATGVTHRGPKVSDLEETHERVDPRVWPASGPSVCMRTLDAELAFFLAIRGFQTNAQLTRILPNYFPDPPSCNYGALVEWHNTEHLHL